MKSTIYTILSVAFILFITGFVIAETPVNNAPQPVMQSSPLTNSNAPQLRPPVTIQNQNVRKQTPQPNRPPQNNNHNSSCNTGNCPPVSPNEMLNRNNFNPPQQTMPPMTGNQPPPPNMDEGPQNILIILDASYSMVDRIGNDTKMEIAKRVVINTVKNLPPNTRVGLRVYGHKIGLIGLYPCRKTELLVPINFNTTGEIINRVRRIQPTGQTPISFSLKTAVINDFNGINGPKRIILVSDGQETCDGNPCDFAVDMVRRGIDLKIDVVGFALRDPAAINQLKCVALSTEGKFYTADTEAALARSLQNSFSIKKEVRGVIILNK